MKVRKLPIRIKREVISVRLDVDVKLELDATLSKNKTWNRNALINVALAEYLGLKKRTR